MKNSHFEGENHLQLREEKMKKKKQFDAAAKTMLAAKVMKLKTMAGPAWRFRHHNAKKGERVWEIAGAYVRSLVGNFFRVALEEAICEEKVLFTQAIMLEEAQQFSAGECNKIIGEMTLPVRRRADGVLEFGLTCRRMLGAYGEPIITIPRCSLSNPNKLPAMPRSCILHETRVRINANRLTGVVRKTVACDLINAYADLCVWFDIDELTELLNNAQIQDDSTREICWWAIANQEDLIAEYQETEALHQESTK